MVLRWNEVKSLLTLGSRKPKGYGQLIDDGDDGDNGDDKESVRLLAMKRA